MPLQPLETQRLYQQAAGQIRDLIRSGEYGPGARLPPERELAKRLRISRPTVREAMIALEIAGMIEIRAGAGIFVCDKSAPGRHTILPALDAGPSPFDLLEARRLLECESVERAAKSASNADLASIEEALVDMEVALAKGHDGRDADRLFHARIARAAGNSVFAALVDGLWEGMSAPLFHNLSNLTRLSEQGRMTIRDHRAILHCLVARDPVGARAAMAAHLNHVESILAGRFDLAASQKRERRKGGRRNR
jgi:GntR family transcriptional regulator, transcriptional repressor for pyruvate dehydrogenase complex